ncbi:hypothetical protein BDQ17DRAFT_1174769, partial [Cyathus striatus]
PGHMGISGNEHADREAKLAITDRSSTRDLLPCCLHHPLPANKSAIRAHHQSQLTHLISAMWRASTRYHHTECHLPHRYLSSFRKLLFSLPRKLSTVLVYLITGHAPLRNHLHCIGKVPSCLCSFCDNKPETVDHFLFHC